MLLTLLVAREGPGAGEVPEIVFNEEARGREPTENLLPMAPAFDVLRGPELAVGGFQCIRGRERLADGPQHR